MTVNARRRLVVVDAPPVAELTDRQVTELTRALGSALAGDGPALAPIGTGKERDQIRSMLQLDVPLDRDDIAVVLPTSGSTGEPKGAQLSAGALLHSARATLSRLGGPGRWVVALAPSRIAGLQVLVRSLVAGTAPVPVAGAFTAEAFAAATARARSSGSRLYTALVPTQLVRLLDAGQVGAAALRSYDAVLLGGGASAADLLQHANSAGVHVVTTYGMTETCGGCVYDGLPLHGVEVDLLPVDATGADVGRVRIRGPVVFAGYRLRPDLTARALVDGCHLTEDLGRFGPEGRLEILGRLDDVVVSGGLNVPLLAVEQAVSSYPGVAEAGAVGVPDPEWGTRVVAYVVLRPGVSPPALDAVRDHVAALHPRAWAPRQLVEVDALPVLASGKLDRTALRVRAGGAGSGDGAEPGDVGSHGRPAPTQAS